MGSTSEHDGKIMDLVRSFFFPVVGLAAAVLFGMMVGFLQSVEETTTRSCPQQVEKDESRGNLSEPKNNSTIQPSPRTSIASDQNPADTFASEQERLARQVEALEQKLSFGRILIKGYESELEGQPLSWTKDIPEEFTPTRFQNVVEKVFKECDLPGELVRIDCKEPPCLALIRIDETKAERVGWDFKSDCRPWNDAYRWGTLFTHQLAKCPDDEHEVFGILTAPSMRQNSTDGEIENIFLRVENRWKEIAESLGCQPIDPREP